MGADGWEGIGAEDVGAEGVRSAGVGADGADGVGTDGMGVKGVLTVVSLKNMMDSKPEPLSTGSSHC